MPTQAGDGDTDEPRYWFRRRRRGYGPGLWSLPASWEGWAAYAVHVTIVVLAAAFAPPALSIVVLAVATLALIVVAARFGEPPPPAPPLPSDE